MFLFVFLSTALLAVNGQYRGASRDYNNDYDGGSSSNYEEPRPAAYRPQQSAGYTQPSYQPQQPLQPQPAIIMHKQAQTHDGGFNYAFAADNGLKQGESIAPDGTRTGAYQYVDPNGKTISVKYTAGKDGFKILEGAHIPKPHPAIAQQIGQKLQPQYQPQPYQPQYQAQPQVPQYKSYQSAPPAVYSKYNSNTAQEDDGQYRGESAYTNGPQTFSPAVSQAKYVPQPQAVIPQYRAASNAIQRNEEVDYNVEPGKPHSFGSGYSFEFAG